jgi:hypothetical protein
VVSGLLFALYHGDMLHFKYHFIFNLFKVLFNYLHMDHCDQIYTPEEFRSWKIENLRQYLTMRGLAKTRKEELAALCFSACKLNLPLVPPKDDALQDKKRC